MRALYLIVPALAVANLFPDTAAAQSTIAWQSDLATAQQLAAQTNRLVVIHFGAPWCQPCQRLERDVFTQPGLGQSLEPSFVPVKLNLDDHAELARQYGVQGIPADVVIAPDGRLIRTLYSPADANEYARQLNEVAETVLAHRSPLAAVNQANAGSYDPIHPAAMPNIAASQLASNNQLPPAEDPYSSYYAQRYGHDYQQPPDPGLTAGGYVKQPQQQLNAGSPPVPQGFAPPSAGPVREQWPPPMAGETQVPFPAVTGQPAPPPNAFARQPAVPPQKVINPTMNPGAAPAGPATADMAQGPSPGMPQTGPYGPPNGSPGLSPQGTLPAQSPYQVQGPPVGLPMGAPPLTAGGAPSSPPNNVVMDGFCPVTLTDSQQWVPGDPMWGAVHRGRTYLFRGPEQQRKFLANPDHYSPVVAGHDPVIALDHGQLVPGYREHGVFYGNRVYLFANEQSLARFRQNPVRYAAAAQRATQF